MIPVIGGVLQESGQLEDITSNLRIGQRPFLALSPALLGLLPIPGGALFSAPLVEGSTERASAEVKSAINVWFRHVLFFVYPLSPQLLIPAQVANRSVYSLLWFQVPFFLFALALGYVFLLRRVEGVLEYDGAPSGRALAPPLFVLLLAPVLDFTLQRVLDPSPPELATFAAIGVSLVLALALTGTDRRQVLDGAVREMEPWNFTVLILAIFLFINVVSASPLGDRIGTLALPTVGLAVGVGFFLGVATGRIDLGASILFPVFLASQAWSALPPLLFAVTFFALFLGYAITPVHPCVSISLEYFDGDLAPYLRTVTAPVVVALGVAAVAFVYFS